jgi:hypothetical protein
MQRRCVVNLTRALSSLVPYPSSSLIVNSLSLFLQKCWMFLIVFNTFECVPLKSELKKDEERRRKERCKKSDMHVCMEK